MIISARERKKQHTGYATVKTSGINKSVFERNSGRELNLNGFEMGFN